MKHRKLAFLASSDLIAQSLQLPSDVSIIGAGWDEDKQSIRLVVESEKFPESNTPQIPDVIPARYNKPGEQILWAWPTPDSPATAATIKPRPFGEDDYVFEDERKAIIKALEKDPEAGKRLFEEAKRADKYRRAGMIAGIVDSQGKKWQ
jgi:hypothetical protein